MTLCGDCNHDEVFKGRAALTDGSAVSDEVTDLQKLPLPPKYHHVTAASAGVAYESRGLGKEVQLVLSVTVCMRFLWHCPWNRRETKEKASKETDKHRNKEKLLSARAVSYTHLTLPTILLV
eukprot:6485285-Amphidinium_carterae.1